MASILDRDVHDNENLVAPAQQCRKEWPEGADHPPLVPPKGIATPPKSRHGPAMIDVRHITRAVALVMVTMLVAANTVVPSLSYAQKYADHLAQYGGYDARVAAISGFASLYVSPEAPMLPVVLSVPSDVEKAAVLPSSCAMDKTVLPSVASNTPPCGHVLGYLLSQTSPVGLDQPALRGPPRASA
jgi:hypothetical protein